MELELGPATDKILFKLPIFDITQPIGIMLSGGLDSAILLMLINKFVPPEKIHIFTVPRPDNAYYHSSNLIDKINQQYKTNFRQPCMVSDGVGFHGRQVWNGILEVLNFYNFIEALYLAENKPPDDIQVKFDAIYPIRAPRSYIHNKIKIPFWSFKKYHIIDLALQMQWLELLNYTHSCCVQPEGRCNKCFNCLERDWSIKQLNLIDTGSI